MLRKVQNRELQHVWQVFHMHLSQHSIRHIDYIVRSVNMYFSIPYFTLTYVTSFRRYIKFIKCSAMMSLCHFSYKSIPFLVYRTRNKNKKLHKRYTSETYTSAWKTDHQQMEEAPDHRSHRAAASSREDSKCEILLLIEQHTPSSAFLCNPVCMK